MAEMTPEERQIQHYLGQLKYRQTGSGFGKKPNGFAYAEVPDWALRQMLEGFRAAVQAEREDCAKLAESFGHHHRSPASKDIAAAIRARGKEEG